MITICGMLYGRKCVRCAISPTLYGTRFWGQQRLRQKHEAPSQRPTQCWGPTPLSPSIPYRLPPWPTKRRSRDDGAPCPTPPTPRGTPTADVTSRGTTFSYAVAIVNTESPSWPTERGPRDDGVPWPTPPTPRSNPVIINLDKTKSPLNLNLPSETPCSA